MRLFLFLPLTLIGCNPMLPTYKLSDETQGLKYHDLIPVHSLPIVDTTKNEHKSNNTDKEFKEKMLVLKCRSSALKNKNKYSPKKVEILLQKCSKQKK